jgi:hypothetical protein
MAEQLVTIKEAEDILGISNLYPSVEKYRYPDPACVSAGHYLYRLADLERVAEKLRQRQPVSESTRLRRGRNTAKDYRSAARLGQMLRGIGVIGHG